MRPVVPAAVAAAGSGTAMTMCGGAAMADRVRWAVAMEAQEGRAAAADRARADSDTSTSTKKTSSASVVAAGVVAAARGSISPVSRRMATVAAAEEAGDRPVARE